MLVPSEVQARFGEHGAVPGAGHRLLIEASASTYGSPPGWCSWGRVATFERLVHQLRPVMRLGDQGGDAETSQAATGPSRRERDPAAGPDPPHLEPPFP